VTEAEAKVMKDNILSEMNRAFEASKTYKYREEDWKTKEWEDLKVSFKYG